MTVSWRRFLPGSGAAGARARAWVRRLALISGGLALGLLAAEAGARLQAVGEGEDLLFRAPGGALRGMYQPDETLLSAPVPGFSGSVSVPGRSVRVAIDERGLRATKARSGPVWLALGDSFTLSVQVDAEDTFEALLSDKLRVQVLNSGVDGYSTWQATERWRRLDPVVDAKVALLTYFLGNDLTDNEVFPHLQQAQRGRTPGVGGPPGPPPGGPGPGGPQGPGGALPPQRPLDEAAGLGLVEGLLFRHSRLYAYVRVAQARVKLQSNNDPEAQKFKGELVVFTSAGASRLGQLIEGSSAPLAQLRDLTVASGDHLMVAIAPPSFVVSQTRAAGTLSAFGLLDAGATATVDAPARRLAELLDRLGIAACDLTHALVAAETAGRAPYLRFDGHWSEAGHAVVADAIAACVAARGWD